MTGQLYSSFPNGAAGMGLFLLRIVGGSGLVEQGRLVLCSAFASESHNGTLGEIAAACALLTGILIIVGLWTSIAASVALLTGLTSYGVGFVHADVLLFALLCIAIALVGPGAWSLDARLFGWKQIRFPRTKTGSRER